MSQTKTHINCGRIKEKEVIAVLFNEIGSYTLGQHPVRRNNTLFFKKPERALEVIFRVYEKETRKSQQGLQKRNA